MRGAVLTAVALVAASIPLHAQSAATPQTTVDASRGGITVSSGVNSLTIGARVQFRWTLDDRDAGDLDTSGTGTGDADGALSQFDVPRLRVSLTGGAFRPWLRYAFQVEMSRTGGEGGSRIKDAVIEIRPTGRPYRIAVGQFKVPFGLQQITSSGRLQFVDRAVTDAKFNPARDMGVLLSGTAAGRTITYDAGVFNGSGESVRQNTRAHLWTGRVAWQPLGPYTLSETAIDAGERTLVHLGVGGRTGKQIRGRTATGVFEEADGQSAVNVEFALKARRLFSTAEHFWMTDEQHNPVAAREIRSRGFHAQAGYTIVPRRVDVGLLVARIQPDVDIDDASLDELRVVTGYYWQAHGLKLQADAGRVEFGRQFATLPARARQGLAATGARLASGRSLEDRQIRVQLQLAF